MDVRNTLLDMYAKCGCPSKAKQMLDSFSRPDVVSWTTVVTAYGLVGDSKTTFSIVDRMMERGEKPNRVTFLTVLSLCSHTGLLDLAQLYLKSMCEDFDLVPGIEHHGCVVDLLGRAGRLEEAMFLAEKMPLQATSSGLWHALLNACRKCGDIALGKLTFENALLLDGADVAAYVGMSNLYGEC
jgi:pentatricopeptide repeat protein